MAMLSTSMIPVSGGKAGEGEQAMDWYAWLSRTRLDPGMAYEYGLVFARNELEEEDIAHFDHEFLLSMGVAVAKHRLEILKLAREERRRRRRMSRPVARLLAAADRTRRCLSRCLRSLAAGVAGGSGGGGGGGAGSTAIVPVVRRRSPFGPGGGRLWGGRKVAALKQGRLMITDGRGRDTGRTTSPAWYDRWGTRKGGGGGDDDEVRDTASEAGEVRWDSMFQDLKPT